MKKYKLKDVLSKDEYIENVKKITINFKTNEYKLKDILSKDEYKKM